MDQIQKPHTQKPRMGHPRILSYPRLLKRSGLSSSDIAKYLENLAQAASLVTPEEIPKNLLRDPTDGLSSGSESSHASQRKSSCCVGICSTMKQMAKRTANPGAIHLRIIEVLKRFPLGATGGQIRQELEKEGLKPEEQTHLDRRKRDLKKWFVIQKIKSSQEVNGKKRNVTLYKYVGKKSRVTDEGQVDQKTRARIIHAAHGQCQMCGMTVQKHGITLVVDHKKPREWGGTNDSENLWAICEECNSGKKAYFSSLNADPEMMKKVMSHESVHVRIGEILKAVGVGNRTPSSILQAVADQDDWHKRLRELRYSVIGWEIETLRYKSSSGKTQVDYILKSYKPWPDDPTGTIRKFEKEREQKNKDELE